MTPIDLNSLSYRWRDSAGSADPSQYKDAAYAVELSANGQDYTFIPDSTINKGVSYGGNTFVLPWFLSKDNLGQLGQLGQKVDLADSSVADKIKEKISGTTTGFLVPSGSLGFDSSLRTFPTSEGNILGMTEKDGSLVYAQSGNSNQLKYLDSPSGTDLISHTTTYTPGHSILGDLFGGFGDEIAGFVNNTLGAVNSLGPLGTAAIYAVSPTAGAAISGANTGQAIAAGAPIGDIATNLAASYAGSQLGSAVGSELGNQAAGQIAGGTTSGLLQGKDLETALGNAALNTGAYQAAGGLMNAVNAPSTTSTPAADYSTGANYDLTTGQNTGGLGLTATPAPLDMSNPYSFDTTAASTGGLGVSLSDIGLNANPLTGQALGSSLAGINTGVDQTGTELPTAANPNPATQNLLAKLLLTGLTGNTTGTNNMATTTANNNLLGSLLGGGLTSAGGLMQGSTTAAAQQAQADALRQAGQLASSQAQFRPVGTTTTFGTSNFQVDPTTGQLTSAGYTLSPEMQAYQNQIMGANRQSLNDATTLQNLGRGYLAQSPQEAAQNWLAGQQALLQPGRDVESARLANQLQQTGRTGVSVAQGGALGMANPEQQALANARAMQDLQLASQAQQQGQAQTTFGQGLLSSAYQPFQAGINTAGTIEGMAQQPLTLSSDLAKQSSLSGAKAGELGLKANTAAATAALGAANYNPWATAMQSLGGSNLFGAAAGNLLGNTSVGSALGSWLGGLNPTFSDTSGWSNGGNGTVTLADGTTVNLADYFNNPNAGNTGGYTDLSF